MIQKDLEGLPFSVKFFAVGCSLAQLERNEKIRDRLLYCTTREKLLVNKLEKMKLEVLESLKVQYSCMALFGDLKILII